MYKIFLALCLALTAVQAEYARNDDYINLNNLQYQKVLDDYDRQLAFFEEHYAGRVDVASVQSEQITAAVVQNEKRLNPLVLLGDYFKKCVAKHSAVLPTVLATKKAIATCELAASKQLTVLLSNPRNIRNELKNYLDKSYQQYLRGCSDQNSFDSTNYTVCVTSVTALANTFTIENQKRFAVQLEAAVCAAKAHIKALLDCTYTEQTRVTDIISQVNVLIKSCLDGKDECKPCEKYTCSESYDLEVNSKSETINNPFYGRGHHSGCLMLNAKKH